MKSVKPLIILIIAVFMGVWTSVGVFADGETSFSYTYDSSGVSQAVPEPYKAYAPISGKKSFGGVQLNDPKDIYVSEKGEIYILDSGNSRIAVLSSSLEFERDIRLIRNGNRVDLSGAEGIFVSASDKIYVADKSGAAVYTADNDGNITSVISAPPADKVESGFEFAPTHVLADSAGVVYVISANTYSGALQYDTDGSFLGFFGSNRVEVNLKVIMNRIWRRILSSDAAAGLQRSVPVSFVQFDIDRENFVYTVKSGTGSSGGQVRKINPNSVNILLDDEGNEAFYGDSETYFDSVSNLDITTSFSDIAVDGEGYITLLDSTRKRLFQYDGSTNLLYAFGGAGNRRGTFVSPVAIDTLGDKIIVLDSGIGGLHIFEPTDFAFNVRAALSLYNKGLYGESEEHWKAILKQDAYYELANIGMGKIRERTGDYAAAMKYYKTGNSRQNYSNAFAARRDEAMRKGFVFLVIGVAAVLLGIVAALTVSERRVINEYNRELSARSYPLYCLKSPFKGYSLLKETKQGSGVCAAVILCVFTAVGIISTQLTAFHYNPDSGRQFNIFAVLAETLGIFLLFVICNWAVSTLADGKGKFGEIIIFTSYALIPLIITEVMLLVSSNVFSLKEQAFYGIIRSVGLIWTAVHIFVSNKEVHEYSGGKALLVLFGSVFGMYLLILIITVAYSMFAQLLSFISMVISEIRA